MSEHIVIAFRMPHPGLRSTGAASYVTRARTLFARGEALGARLVAWGAGVAALAWDLDSIDEALLLATSIAEESVPADCAWACGIAEGPLEPIWPDDVRKRAHADADLSWGEPLQNAISLSRIAHPGEVLVDGDVRAVRASQLALVGEHAGTDAGRRVRGFRLRLDQPWREAACGTSPFARSEASDRAGALELADSADGPPSQVRRDGAGLALRIREIVRSGSRADVLAAVPELAKEANHAEATSAPVHVRCKAELALAMALAVAGRTEEALRAALGALAIAREAESERAVAACFAVLAKVYAGLGWDDAASRLRELALSEAADASSAPAAGT